MPTSSPNQLKRTIAKMRSSGAAMAGAPTTSRAHSRLNTRLRVAKAPLGLTTQALTPTTAACEKMTTMEQAGEVNSSKEGPHNSPRVQIIARMVVAVGTITTQEATATIQRSESISSRVAAHTRGPHRALGSAKTAMAQPRRRTVATQRQLTRVATPETCKGGVSLGSRPRAKA